ncbi:type VI secretion system Vgr family protein [Oceanospirillum maris]|uniref:type VI secretion system Vgr family protein n=1 Tax=Oceanospirillum maris TaxID=64977 RepID=UPI0004037FF0|nr:type VI secretion system tip protein TssI/VgrG [Oceanospirillum maris]
MNLSSDVVFSFQCDGIEENSFKVLSFTGSEKLGELYQFDIQLVSYSDTVDPDQLLDSSCHLSIQSYDKTRQFNGILSNFSYLNPTENGHLFQATLVPKLWLLSQFTTNEVYLGLNLSDTLALLFDEAGLTSDEYDLSQISHYREWDYRCQFGESHYSFLKRITEREGVYFYFSQENNTAKAIFCNKNNQHPTQTTTSTYTPITGSSYSEGSPVIFQWTQNNQRVPKEVIVKDYNNDRPSVDLSARSKVDPSGLGEVFRYCDNLYDSDEASILADIRAEELFMQKTQFFGSSLDIEISPGYPLILTAHPLQKLNNEYCPISISHSGYASDLMQTQKSSEQPYSNTIQAISVDVQFRPEQKTEKPRFYGVLNALVDSEGDGKYAHIDKRGRYRVTLPFDRKDRDGAQASWWIPMSQPNAGENSGMHFPLLKGAEVLLSFIGGDPDRPVITGAVPNASKPSVVSEENHTTNKIQTAAGNVIELEDDEDNKRIKLFSPNGYTYMHLGAANPFKAEGFMFLTQKQWFQEIAGGYQTTLISKAAAEDLTGVSDDEKTFKDTKPAVAIDSTRIDAIRSDPTSNNGTVTDIIDEQVLFQFPWLFGSDTGEIKSGEFFSSPHERSGMANFHRETGEKYTWTDGNTYTFGGAKDFGYGNGYEVNYVDPDSVSDWDGSLNLDYFSIPGYNPDTLLISKTIGDTYDYQSGNKEEVYFGLDEVSRAATLASTEVKVTGVNTSASLSALNFNFEAGLKFDLTLAAAVDLTFGPSFDRCESKKDISGVQGVSISSGAKISLCASPLVVPNPPATTWGKAVTGATSLATKLGLTEQAIGPLTSGGSLELTPSDVKLAFAGPTNQLSINATGTELTTPKISITSAASATISAVAAIDISGAIVSTSGTTAMNIEAPTVSIKGTVATNVQSATVSVKADTALSLQGTTISMKANAMGNVNAGGMLKVSASGLVQLG